MKSLIFLSVGLLILNSSFSQKVKILPEQPQRNENVTVIYDIKDPAATIPDTVKKIDIVFSYSNFYEMPNAVPLQKIGNVWQTTFTLPRYFLFASFYFRSGEFTDRPDSNSHFVIYPFDNGKPVAKAILNHGYSLRYQMGKRPNLEDLQSEYFKKEIQTYPDSSYEAQLRLLMYQEKKENDPLKKKEIRKEAQQVIANNFYKRPGIAGDLNQTTMGYLIIGENSRLDSIRNIVRLNYPQIQAGYDLVIDSISRIEDTAQIISSLENLIKETNQKNSKYLQDAYVELFKIYAKKKNVPRSLKYLRLFDTQITPYYPRQLFEYSKILYDQNILLDTAYMLADESYTLADKYPTGLTRYFPETGYIPSYSTSEQKKATKLNAQSSTTALKSAIRMKQGRKTEALKLINEATKYTFNPESARFAYTVYNKYKLYDSAYKIYKDLVIFEPESVGELMEELRKTYLNKNAGTKTNWVKEEADIYNSIKNKLKDELSKQMINIKMPDVFGKMQTLDGKYLAENFGSDKIVFINLWATWCVPCMKEMPYVNKVWEKYKTDEEVKFMILNSGANNTIDDAIGWNGNEKYSFPVYFNTDRQLGEKLQFNVIPATFIIDRKGNIRFKFIGFEGPIVQQKLDVALDILKNEM